MDIKHYGLNSEYGSLTSVLLYPPGSEIDGYPDPAGIQQLLPIDHTAISHEFDAVISTFAGLGIEVLRIDPSPLDDDRRYLYNMMYCRDLFFMTPEGAILANMANSTRKQEVLYAERALKSAGIPVLHAVSGEGRFEGADALWVKKNLVVVGVGNRTNREAFDQIRHVLGRRGVECVEVPFCRRETQHLLGVLQIVDKDLALVRHEVADSRIVDFLERHGLDVVRIPENSEVRTKQAMNIVTLSPRNIIMTRGCPLTKEIYLKAGLAVAAELDLTQLIKGAGGLACATGIIARG